MTAPIAKSKARVSAAARKFRADFCAFLSEWKVVPSARMTSAFVVAAKKGLAKDYLVGRFTVSKALSDFAPEIEKKCESAEFVQLATQASALTARKLVNSKLALFYGKPGSGKSTFAKTQFPTAERYFCTEDRRAIDLVSEVALDFESGKKGFVPSTIARAMEAGRPVILDEINLLDDAVLAAIQQMVDDTDSIEVAGNKLQVKPGFMIVGTFNIETGIGPRPLPEPLVDRAAVIREFQQPDDAECAAWAGLE